MSLLKSEASLSDEGWEDYLHWQQNDLKILEKSNDLVKAIMY